MITLTHTESATSITLPDALNWVDEYTWSPVQQSQTYTTTGALLIEEAVKQAGRPITLEGAADTTWQTRADLDLLHTWAQTPAIVLLLTLRGVQHSVTFDHSKEALQGIPILFYADSAIASTDNYAPTIRFLEL